MDHSANHETSLVLRKSSVRRGVLKYLASVRPETSYPAEIARYTDFSSTQVIGALRGLDGRDETENSLIAHGLVEVEVSKSKENGKDKVERGGGIKMERKFTRSPRKVWKQTSQNL